MGKMIFIVDDTDSILTLAASVLEDEYRVLTMLSAEKMFSLLAKKQPDLILLDVEMPVINGFEAIEKLKGNPEWSGIPVVFLTGYIDDSVISRASEAGALCVIDKADISNILLHRIREIIQ